MPILDTFAVTQANANIELESLNASDTVKDMIQRGLNGEYTTTDIIKHIVDSSRA